MRASVLATALLLACAPPVAAIDIIFNGTVANTCDLSIQVPVTGGIMHLGVDPTILGSDQSGTGVLLTIGSTGSNTITVGAPTLTASPVGYNASGQSVEIGYVGAGLLSATVKPMGPGGGSFSAGLFGLSVSTILLNARVTNPNGFKLGDYTITSVVTCS